MKLEVVSHDNRVIETWTLEPDGTAKMVNATGLPPLYSRLGDLTPKDGKAFLEALKEVLSRQTYIGARTSQ